MLLGLLALLHAPALAADSWNATCPTRDDRSVWFVFSSAPDAPPLPDFDCKGLFFDSTVSCTQTLGLGKIKATGQTPGGYPTYDLRYLPYGDIPTIMSFLGQVGGGVLYKPPSAPAPTSYAATPSPLTPDELLAEYLHQRNKASAATNNVTLHVWSCPDAKFVPPISAIEPYGMKLVSHEGRTSMY